MSERMISLTIDNVKVEVPAGTTVLEAAKQAGINIPTLCYHSELSVYGACRLCTCEFENGITFSSCSEKNIS